MPLTKPWAHLGVKGGRPCRLLVLSLPSQGIARGQRSRGRVACLQGCAARLLLGDASVQAPYLHPPLFRWDFLVLEEQAVSAVVRLVPLISGG